jgi:uncharacterized protein (TIGR00255 family)
MTLKSMTGFASSDGHHANLSWRWDLRSVNGRSLELRLRMPPGFESLEMKARSLCQAKLARGNCHVGLNVKRLAGQVEIRLNEEALTQAAEVAQRARQLLDAPPASLDTLLSLRGVVEVIEAEESEEATGALASVLLAGLEAALDRLLQARAEEGRRLAEIVGAQVEKIGELTERVDAAPGRSPEAIGQRLSEQIARLVEAGGGLDPDRLHQEAVLLAAKADVQEEIDRLRAHVASARELLAGSEPAGRRLDFLAQEFNREANTLCAKANDVELSRLGLELKAVIDQLREQVQNIE